ncbi:MAG: hypothetical protein QXD27_09410 [Metallosphaera sp.]
MYLSFSLNNSSNAVGMYSTSLPATDMHLSDTIPSLTITEYMSPLLNWSCIILGMNNTFFDPA